MNAIEPLCTLSAQGAARIGASVQVSGKEDLILTNDLAKDLKAVESALSECDQVYCRGRRLVQVIDNPLGCGPGSNHIPLEIETLNASALMVSLSEVKNFLMKSKQRLLSVYPPGRLVNALLAMGKYPNLRPLRGVTQVPVLRQNGTILQEAGYDISTELFYQPLAEFPPVPEMPTTQEIKDAVDILLGVVVDFPFAESEIGRAVFLAAVLTIPGRFAFLGPIPMILVGGNMPGTGKGKLADAVGLITTGQTIPRSNQLQSETEERKRITAILSKGRRIYLIDNVSNRLGGPCLDALLTSDIWADRILGKSLEVTLPNHLLVIATGNNIQVQGDTARRCLLIKLLCREEHPEARSNFHHPELEIWIREHQPELLTAALTILRGYIAAGRPAQDIATLGSYGGWSDLIQSTVKWAMGVDPGEARMPVGEDMDINTEALQLLMSGWLEIAREGEALTCRAAFDRIKGDGHGQNILEAIEMYCPGKKQTPMQLGRLLSHFRQHWLGSARFEYAGDKTANGRRWVLSQAQG